MKKMGGPCSVDISLPKCKLVVSGFEIPSDDVRKLICAGISIPQTHEEWRHLGRAIGMTSSSELEIIQQAIALVDNNS